MATKTTNLGLTKPDGTDKVLILVLNGNFDKIDEAIGAIRAQQIPAEVITAAVEAYMAEHEVASGATEEQANQIEANRTSIETLAQTVENLSAEDVGARPDTWMPTASDVGARPDSWMPTASDVGALKDNGESLHQFKQTTGTGNYWGLEQAVTAIADTYKTIGIRFFGERAQRVARNAEGSYVGYDIYDKGNKPTASDVGALPNTYVAPVTSVNGKTGDVSIDVGVTSVNGKTGSITLPKIGILQYAASWDTTQSAFCIPVSAFSNPASTTNASKLAFLVQAYGKPCIIGDSFVSSSNLYIRAYNLIGDSWGSGETLNIIYLTN